MPIRPENRALYPADWKEISKRIRHERANGKCEQCGAPNGQVVMRHADGSAYTLEGGETFDASTGEFLGYIRGSELPAGHFVKIVLTVAHLDHDPANCADENLKAWCQKCHLTYDAKLHAVNAAETRRSKKAVGDLFPTTDCESESSMTRAEHIQWCKTRALEYVDSGDLAAALASLLSDLSKHDETCGHGAMELCVALSAGGLLGSQDEVRKFIEGVQ
jgi:hypothetical protein